MKQDIDKAVRRFVRRAKQVSALWSETDVRTDDLPLTLAVPRQNGTVTRVVLTTKCTAFRWDGERRPEGIVVAWKIGFWDPLSVEVIAGIAIAHGADVRFVGDLSPLSVIIYLAACISFRNWGITVHHGGINSDWIDVCKTEFRSPRSTSWKDVLTTPMCDAEKAISKSLLASIPSCRAFLGEAAIGLLLDGKKLAIEGASNKAFYRRTFYRKWRRLFYGPLEKHGHRSENKR